MRLRKSITLPARYEEDDPQPTKCRNGTRATYPALLKEQVIPFNPYHSPAAFPSLSLKAKDAFDHIQAETESELLFNDTSFGRKGPGIDISRDANDLQAISIDQEPTFSNDIDLALEGNSNPTHDNDDDVPALVDMIQQSLHDTDEVAAFEDAEHRSMVSY